MLLKFQEIDFIVDTGQFGQRYVVGCRGVRDNAVLDSDQI